MPMADVAPMKVPDGMTDEEVLFLTDIFPTGYQAAEQAGIEGGEIVAIWGSGPVGLFAIQSAKVLGAERIIAIETVPERIAVARKAGATDIVNFAEEDVFERIKEISKGEGANVVIDCVGMEASPSGQAVCQRVKEKVMPAERTYVLDQAIKRCAVRRGLSARRLRGAGFSQHGLDRAERYQALQRPDARKALSRAPDQAHSRKESRHHFPHHPPQHRSHRGSRSLSDLQNQEGRLRESGVPSRGMTFSGNHISLQASLDMKRSFPWLRKH